MIWDVDVDFQNVLGKKNTKVDHGHPFTLNHNAAVTIAGDVPWYSYANNDT